MEKNYLVFVEGVFRVKKFEDQVGRAMAEAMELSLKYSDKMVRVRRIGKVKYQVCSYLNGRKGQLVI